MLPSVVVCGSLVDPVDADSVVLLPVVGVWVVGVFLTEKLRDWAPQSFRVKTMVRFSPAGRGGIIVVVIQINPAEDLGLIFKKRDADVPLLRMDRSVKLAQQELNRMVVFPSSPPTLFPLESFRLAITVRVVTPTETQFPCRQRHHTVFTDSRK